MSQVPLAIEYTMLQHRVLNKILKLERLMISRRFRVMHVCHICCSRLLYYYICTSIENKSCKNYSRLFFVIHYHNIKLHHVCMTYPRLCTPLHHVCISKHSPCTRSKFNSFRFAIIIIIRQQFLVMTNLSYGILYFDS